jgi:hypothetical protein
MYRSVLIGTFLFYGLPGKIKAIMKDLVSDEQSG